MKNEMREGVGIGHGVGQGLGWLGFWLMLGMCGFQSCSVDVTDHIQIEMGEESNE